MTNQWKTAILAAALAVAFGAEAAPKTDLMGYTAGADVISVPVTDGRIDVVSGVVYR